jgi:hypothetical protein
MGVGPRAVEATVGRKRSWGPVRVVLFYSFLFYLFYNISVKGIYFDFHFILCSIFLSSSLLLIQTLITI